MNVIEFYLRKIYNNYIMKKISSVSSPKSSNTKILFAYCFTIFPMSQYHDYLLAQSLRLRGAQIIPMICGGLQSCSCSVYGGIWGEEGKIDHNEKCKECIKSDMQTWKKWFGTEPIMAKNFVPKDKYLEIAQNINSLEIEDYEKWEYMGIAIGKMAATILKNNWLISSITLDEQNIQKIKIYALNIALMTYASEAIIEATGPDIIYGNDSFYYPWSIVQELAKKKGIPYYNAYSIGKADHYSYALNEPVISIPLREVWEKYKVQEMSDKEKSIINDYLEKRKFGRDMMINTACPDKNCIVKNELDLLDFHKPTALITTNVTWDAAAQDKELFYENILEWVIDTINYFKEHSEWQLIVKAHPAEKNELVHEAKERVVQYIKQKYQNELPTNIFLLDADTSYSMYELLSIISCGIVYTSTAGIEMACQGIPVICVADCFYRDLGFTFDPKDKKQYYDTIKGIMEKDKKYVRDVSDLAKQFFYLYYFIYLFPNTWFSYRYWEIPKLYIKRGKELMPGKNKIVDYLCDKILNKEEIIDAENIPQFGDAEKL